MHYRRAIIGVRDIVLGGRRNNNDYLLCCMKDSMTSCRTTCTSISLPLFRLRFDIDHQSNDDD